ncbi:MAG: AsmA-like C-terminal region-containing protein [Candidatus Gastranaerophilales bacterium]|nr:AsmA-like C-terminal region-containing protein [Candidatus Gastranaerophilales bacterium]
MYVYFERYKTNKINIIEIFNITGFFKVYFHNSSISINKYFFDFVDNYHNPSEKMTVEGNNILLSKFTLRKYLQVIMDGKINYNNKITPFSVSYNAKIPTIKKNYNLEFNLPDIDFETFKNYTKEFAPHLTLKGKGNIQGLISENKFVNLYTGMKNLDIHSSKNKSALKFNDDVFLSTRFSYENNNFVIDEFKIMGKDFGVSSYGKIYDIKKLPLDIDLHIKVDENSNANKIFKILPYNIPVLNHAIDKAKKYNIGGIATGEVHAKGIIGYLNVNGFLNVKEVDLGYNSKLPKSDAKLTFKDDKLILDTIVYPDYNKSEFVTTKGQIKITKPFVLDLDINSAKNMNLPQVQKALNIFSDIFNFKTGPVPIMGIDKGQGNIDLKVHGTPPYMFLNGKMFFNNGITSYPGLNGKLSNVSGDIFFNGKEINYKNIKGAQSGVWAFAHGSTKIHENGLTHFYLDIPSASLSFAKNFVDNSSLLEKVSTSIKFLNNPEGIGSLNMVIISDKETAKQPDIEGTVKIKNSSSEIEGLAYRVHNVNGIIDFTTKQSKLNFDGIINGINTELTGVASQGYSNIDIITPAADVKLAYELIYNSPLFEKSKNAFNDFSEFSGTIKTKTKIFGNFDTKTPNFYTEIDILNGKLKYLDVPEFIYVNKGRIIANQDKVLFENIRGTTYNNPFKLDGTVINQGSENENRNIIFKTDNFDLKNIQDIIGTKLITPQLKELLDNFSYISGNIDITTYVTQKNNKANIKFHDVSVCYKPTKRNILIKTGEFFFSEELLKMKKLIVQMEDSDLIIDGFIHNYFINPFYNMQISSNLSDKDFNETIVPLFKLPVQLMGKIYTSIDFKGTVEDWQMQARAMLDDESFVLYKGANLGEDLSKFMFFDLSGQNNNVRINTFDIYKENSTSTEYRPDILAQIRGNIKNISSDFPILENVEAKLYDYMSISFLNIVFYNSNKKEPFFERGLIKGDVKLNGDINNLSIAGTSKIKNTFIPSLKTTINNMVLDFQQNNIFINKANVDIAGSNAEISAKINGIYSKPLVIDEFIASSELINFDEIIKTFNPVISENLNNNKNKNNQNFIINNGSFNIEKIIYKKLLMNNITGAFSIDNNNLLSIKNMKSDLVQGSINGDIDYNFSSKEINGNIELNNVIANAVATTFLNLPNEIYGNMDANIKFSTKGKTNEEMIKNMNGFSYFNIKNGRMIRLGSVEYMLKVANTFKGGITRLNLNAIVNMVAPRTGYFDTIEGDIQIKKGIVLADKITSKSKELNLFLTGSYDMNESEVNATIIGQMPAESKESVLWLGPIGKISLNSLVKKLKKEVSKEQHEFNNLFLHNPVEYINNIPGLKNNKGDFRFFVISLKGNLYNEKYVKNFKWIK